MFSYISLLLFFLAFLLMIAILKIKNTILSLFQFIFCVIIISISFLNFGLEFIPLCLIIIYVGVIAILFLFSLIMYNFSNQYFNDYDFTAYFFIFFFPIFKILQILIFVHNYFILVGDNYFKITNLDFIISLNYDLVSFINLYNVYGDYIILFSYLLFVIFLGLVITRD